MTKPVSQTIAAAGLVALLALTVGCRPGEPTKPKAEGANAAAASPYRLASEPAGAKGVAEAHKAVKDNEEVALVGRIGGAVKPFVDGIAAFDIVDPQLKPCEDGCEAPWDYCCDLDKLPTQRATVKVVDAEGNPVMTDARELLGVKELSTVVVRGKAKRGEKDSLVVLAVGVYVRP